MCSSWIRTKGRSSGSRSSYDSVSAVLFPALSRALPLSLPSLACRSYTHISPCAQSRSRTSRSSGVARTRGTTACSSRWRRAARSGGSRSSTSLTGSTRRCTCSRTAGTRPRSASSTGACSSWAARTSTPTSTTSTPRTASSSSRPRRTRSARPRSWSARSPRTCSRGACHSSHASLQRLTVRYSQHLRAP